MIEIKFETGGDDPDAFNIYKDKKKIGEMIVETSGKDLIVYHTEIDVEEENNGYASQLLEHMVSYAREHHLGVAPLCPYVHVQFQRHPEKYKDIWENPDKK